LRHRPKATVPGQVILAGTLSAEETAELHKDIPEGTSGFVGTPDEQPPTVQPETQVALQSRDRANTSTAHGTPGAHPSKLLRSRLYHGRLAPPTHGQDADATPMRARRLWSAAAAALSPRPGHTGQAAVWPRRTPACAARPGQSPKRRRGRPRGCPDKDLHRHRQPRLTKRLLRRAAPPRPGCPTGAFGLTAVSTIGSVLYTLSGLCRETRQTGRFEDSFLAARDANNGAIHIYESLQEIWAPCAKYPSIPTIYPRSCLGILGKS